MSIKSETENNWQVELNEHSENIDAHVESFAKWCSSTLHLKIPENKEFLMRFLRTAKYDHSVAQKRLDNYCTLRRSHPECSKFFDWSTLSNEIIDEVLDLNLLVPLGCSDDGQLVILVQFGLWDPNSVKLIDLMRVLFMGIDLIAAKTITQTHGITVIMDLDRANTKINQIWNQCELFKNWKKIWEETYPMRLKNLIFFREPVIFDIHCSISELLMKSKMKKRTLRLKNDIEKLATRIPGLMRLLPFEYNGQSGPLDALRNKWKREFKGTYASEHFILSQIEVIENKRFISKAKVNAANLEPVHAEGTFTKFDKF